MAMANSLSITLEEKEDIHRILIALKLVKFVELFDTELNVTIHFVLDAIDKAHEASTIIFNTFDAFEHDVLEALSTMYPPIYLIGPLQFLLDQFPQNHLNSIGSSLWKEETEYLSWLDSKQPNLVIYVNFGSITVMTPLQLIEFAWGLSNRNQTFLWVIRPDLVVGDSAILPPNFVSETKERSLLASWCPQEQVLNHPSVGGFLTHSGWNSTLESICSGVLMLCWPFFAEQQTNCWSRCSQWGVGMEIHSDVKREEVERMVRELMGGERGKEMKRKVREWKKWGEEATTCSIGSSYLNFEKMVRLVLMSAGLNQSS
ncbi:7-deoxyloganetin glucosyltransferase-like [Camellia sinensis]|uniref:7-deoxyloganetin glucosyltransferase-like n=1 Tax=Camellia sinensis TaxID=4442 RepID=UPI0010362AF3|nr:7-deoxyloganetin glucosyltransferase-like [Camellia sinensis]